MKKEQKLRKETASETRERRAFEAGMMAVAQIVRTTPFNIVFNQTECWRAYQDKKRESKK
jgi:hypothetical protein